MPSPRRLITLPARVVHPLHSPASFYEHLLQGIASARRRVTLASLYLGTGPMEQTLLQSIVERTRSQPLDVLLQMDASRSLRNVRTAATHASSTQATPSSFTSSAHMLSEAMQRVSRPARMRVGLTGMPQTRSWLAQRMPDRYREGAGVFHMKAYVMDDDVIITGANLSTDYFTNRQDRYLLFTGAPALADYVQEVTNALYGVRGSHYVRSDGGGVAVHGSSCATGHVRGGMAVQATDDIDDAEFSRQLQQVLLRYSNEDVAGGGSVEAGTCTLVPRLQAGGAALQVTHDSDATLALMRNVGPAPVAGKATPSVVVAASPNVHAPTPPHRDVVHMATGYFNLPSSYADALIHGAHAASCIHILTAAPTANGFFNGSSISAGVPMAYSEIERWFMDRVAAAGRAHLAPMSDPTSSGIAMHEYMRHGWTFHGKGLWQLRRSERGGEEMTTLVGSSNFSRRSVERDLEMTLTLHTKDADLVARLNAERAALWSGGAATAEQSLVTAVGSHFPPPGEGTGEGVNVWRHPSRQLRASGGYINGLWIHAATRVLMPFF